MTQFSDQLRQGRAYFEGAQKWNTPGTVPNGMPVATSPSDTQSHGVPTTQQFYYQVGTASTALASGIVYYANTATGVTGTLSATGALVSSGTATLDVPRTLRITASVNLSSSTFTIIGTDGYGQTQKYSILGPTGNTFGNTGSYVDTAVAFKTVTSASQSGGTSTAGLAIGSANGFGLPYVLANVGMALGVYIDGSLATVPATFQAAYTPTGTPTASTTDVRGLCTLATTVLANDSRYITIGMIAPPVNLTVNSDSKVNSFGATPFSG